MLTFYIRAPPLGVEFCRAAYAHIAARSAPVAPRGALRSFAEHGLPCRRFAPHARHGAPFYVF